VAIFYQQEAKLMSKVEEKLDKQARTFQFLMQALNNSAFRTGSPFKSPPPKTPSPAVSSSPASSLTVKRSPSPGWDSGKYRDAAWVHYGDAVLVGTNMGRCMVTGEIVPVPENFSVSHIWDASIPLDKVKFVSEMDHRQRIYCSGRNHLVVLRSVERLLTSGQLIIALNDKSELVTKILDPAVKGISIFDASLMGHPVTAITAEQQAITFAQIDGRPLLPTAHCPCRRFLAQRSSEHLANAAVQGWVSLEDATPLSVSLDHMKSLSPESIIPEGDQPTALVWPEPTRAKYHHCLKEEPKPK
jgi:hypothetical protein